MLAHNSCNPSSNEKGQNFEKFVKALLNNDKSVSNISSQPVFLGHKKLPTKRRVKNSSCPDFTFDFTIEGKTIQVALEAKSYSIKNVNRMIYRLKKQLEVREQNLIQNPEQWIIIDLRNQRYTPDDLINLENKLRSLEFKTLRRYQIIKDDKENNWYEWP